MGEGPLGVAGEEPRGAATIVDVARRAGVSRATAARALGNYGSVRPSTAEAVRQAAEEVGYQANALAKSMITGRTGTVGVVLSDIENQFFVQALRGVSRVARERGYDLLLANTEEDASLERSAVSVMSTRRVEGLIVCPADPLESGHLASVLQGGTPLVLLDRTVADVSADTVGVDNRQAAYEATQQLLRLGHRRIAILSGVGEESMAAAFAAEGGPAPLGETPSEGRVVGFCQALRDAGITPERRWSATTGFHREDAFSAVSKLLDQDERPTAIVASDSLQTLGALQAIRAAGLSVPADISLLGFDDADWAEVVEPPITVVQQPAYEIGSRAVEFLLDRVEGREGPGRSALLPTRLIERQSVAPPQT